jgi:hypothetical protein
MPATPLTELTEASLTGKGVFDVLMAAQREHLDAEFNKNRIRGPEYATVYLGSLEATLATALQFLMQGKKSGLEAELLAQQIELAKVELQKAQAELALLQDQQGKLAAEIAQLTAQTALTTQQTANAVIEGTVLTATKCKLDAEFDNLVLTKAKIVAETTLLNQKTATEKAQITALGVDADSVVGKQITLYGAQAAGFARDAEQKAAKILVDSWNARRMTDEATVADAVNQLNDAAIGRVVSKLLTGVNA